MLAYLTLGSNNKDKAIEFYDAVLGEMGAKRVFANERLQFYGTGPGAPMLAVWVLGNTLKSPKNVPTNRPVAGAVS